MSQSKDLNEGIRHVNEFVCTAIPGKSVADTIPEKAKPSRVRNAGIAMQEETPPSLHAEDPAAFRARLNNLPAAQILTLLQHDGLTPEQLRIVQEVVMVRVNDYRAEVQQLNEVLQSASR